MTMQGAKIFLLPWKFSMIYKKQMTEMYNSAFTGKENASENWNCILSMFLTSFNVYFYLVMHVYV